MSSLEILKIYQFANINIKEVTTSQRFLCIFQKKISSWTCFSGERNWIVLVSNLRIHSQKHLFAAQRIFIRGIKESRFYLFVEHLKWPPWAQWALNERRGTKSKHKPSFLPTKNVALKCCFQFGFDKSAYWRFFCLHDDASRQAQPSW